MLQDVHMDDTLFVKNPEQVRVVMTEWLNWLFPNKAASRSTNQLSSSLHIGLQTCVMHTFGLDSQ